MYRVKRELVAEKVIEGIIEYITLNELKPGDKLPTERELSERFSVGRPAIREALCALSVMRVINIIQGDGIYFSDMSGAFLFNPFKLYMDLGIVSTDDLFEVWIFLEADTAGLAASRITPEQMERLKAALQKSSEGIESEKVFKLADTELHEIICEASGNPLLIGMMASIKELVEKVRTITTKYREIRILAHAAHEKICAALLAHESEDARKYMEEHLRDIKKSADLRRAFYDSEISDIFRKEFNIQ